MALERFDGYQINNHDVNDLSENNGVYSELGYL